MCVVKHSWKVVPLCKEQLLDIKPEDVVPGGVFRLCDVYKSGGGYDRFPEICEKRLGMKAHPKQFVVQLRGCHLNCPYCYVTPSGVWGEPELYTSDDLANEFLLAREYAQTDINVFHLMGGSPALRIEYWPELIDRLDNHGSFIFHSDLTLTEKRFNRHLLGAISQPNCLYAVNVKGVTSEDYERNTGKTFDSSLFWTNLWELKVAKVPFYMTFTNPDMEKIDKFYSHVESIFGEDLLNDSFIIDLKEYDAVEAYNANRGT